MKLILARFPLKMDMPPAAVYGSAGRHDFIICQRGLFWTIETKRGDKKPTELQINYAIDIWRAGGMSILVNELKLDLVEQVCTRVHQDGMLPYELATNFEEYRSNASKKRRTGHAPS